MRKRFGICFAAIVLVFSGVQAGWAGGYLSGNLGVVLANDADFELFGDTGELTYDPGAGVTVAIGSTLGGDNVRGELELAVRANDLDTMKVAGFGTFMVDGDITSTSLMANLFIDLAPNAVISPFVGAGAGFSAIDLNIEGLGSGDKTVLAYQFAGGAAFAATDKLSVDVQYRYFATEDPDLDGLTTEYATQNIMVGLRLMF